MVSDAGRPAPSLPRARRLRSLLSGAAKVPLRWFLALPAWARVFAVVFVVYALATLGRRTLWITHTSLAWSILNGTFSLMEPFGTTELIPDIPGKIFVAYGVTPSLFLAPFVAIFGRGINQTLACAAFGALAVAAWWAYLGRLPGIHSRSRTWLTVLFAAGTPFFFYSVYDGNNWAITHVVGGLCLMAAFAFSQSGHPGWAGLLFGLAVLSRNAILYLAPVMVLLVTAATAPAWREIRWDWRKLGLFAIGAAISLCYGAYYNWERFGNPFENGYNILLTHDPIADFGRRASFALEYAQRNIPFYLFHGPARLDKFPWYGPEIWGLGIFYATPALILAALADWRKPLHQVALICALAVQGLYFLFVGDGRTQFGMRYSLDYLPVMMLLIAAGTAHRFGRLPIILTVAGILVEIWGLVTWHAMGW